MRTFIAIPVPEDDAPELARVQAALDVGRAVPPENWHVTLAFLGRQSEATLADLHDRLSRITAAPFETRIAGLTAVGGRQPVLLAAEVERVPPLVALRKAVRNAVRAAGIDLSRERFRPHVTLARFPRRMEASDIERIGRVLQAWGDVDAGCLPVDRFALYRSHLGAEGAQYEPLAEYRLGQRQV